MATFKLAARDHPNRRSRPGPKRLGLLALMRDHEKDHDGSVVFYPPGAKDSTLHRYGLTVWDTLTITMAERAGLIEQKGRGFYRLTDEGRQLIERCGFELVCDFGKPCQQCIRAGRGEL